jgi:hypothetical protein
MKIKEKGKNMIFVQFFFLFFEIFRWEKKLNSLFLSPVWLSSLDAPFLGFSIVIESHQLECEPWTSTFNH